MRLNWSVKKVKKVTPYEQLAPIYDHIMRHVDYRFWAEYAHNLIRRFLPDALSVLDIACGTGSLLQELARTPYQLLGCDLSFAMVLQARNKLERKNIPVWQAEMKTVALKKPVDVILCLYDSINYVMEPAEIAEFFARAKDNLSTDGIIIFDICTERNSIEFFYNYYDHEHNNNFSYDRWSHYDRKNRIQFTEFKIRFRANAVPYFEVHQQRIYRVVDMLQFIESSQLHLLDYYDDFSLRPPHAKSNRIHFVVQRKD